VVSMSLFVAAVQYVREVAMPEWFVLVGVLVIVVGFLLKLDVIAVVIAAALVTTLAAGESFLAFLDLLGKAFVENRAPSNLLRRNSLSPHLLGFHLEMEAQLVVEVTLVLSAEGQRPQALDDIGKETHAFTGTVRAPRIALTADVARCQAARCSDNCRSPAAVSA